ncbi:YdcF family protein [Halobacillus sp. B23F22_1]|uniref:YdcF family protein n=1 Tax=Halobacillus sp. B23F22_1 TaxID=3459514 RepID=UPI00373F2DFA
MSDHTIIAKKILRGFFLLSFLFGLIILILLFTFGPDRLIINSSPSPSDAIIVLSGNEGRLEHAIELYEDDLADTIILSNSTEKGTKPEEAIELGVKEAHIIEEKKASSTYDNAVYSRELMKEHELESAIVVTSNYHSRRSKFTFERVFVEEEIELSFSTAPSYYDPDDGLTKREAQTVFSEWVKLIGYFPVYMFG